VRQTNYIPGVGPVYREKLGSLNLQHVTDVLEHVGTDAQRQYINEETGAWATARRGWRERPLTGRGARHSDAAAAPDLRGCQFVATAQPGPLL
jgi:hypothetical protein